VRGDNVLLGDWADPRLWPLDAPREPVVYLSDTDASLVALLDPVDWDWARRHKWGFVTSNMRKNGREKFYACRTVMAAGRTFFRVYLHKEVVLRAHGDPPTSAHTIGDHRDGNSLDCRRDNLRWATPSMNRMNIDGRFPWDLFDG
jgi:HNH endonuclease